MRKALIHRLIASSSQCLPILAGQKQFSVNADVDFEVIATSGQKLQLSSFATVVMQRPSHVHIDRKGMIADFAFIYDGNTLTMQGKNLNIYTQYEGTGTIDDAIRAYEMETGLAAPGADLLLSDPYTVLSEGVESSIYVGTAYINGVECHHLAFREAKVDWQLWVQTGDTPLPMKYVITSKWQTGAPQYELRFRDWNTNPQIDDAQFTFSAPEGAKKLDSLSSRRNQRILHLQRRAGNENHGSSNNYCLLFFNHRFCDG